MTLPIESAINGTPGVSAVRINWQVTNRSPPVPGVTQVMVFGAEPHFILISFRRSEYASPTTAITASAMT
ncbi:MAG TPA: hypothetical protein V6D18_15025 [Thermosynechococcaceae cyanobacterium]